MGGGLRQLGFQRFGDLTVPGADRGRAGLPAWPQTRGYQPGPTEVPAGSHGSPEAALWAALVTAGPRGASIADLIQATGKGRTWVYERLRHLADAGRVIQTLRGHWRAAGPPGDDAQ